MRTSEAGLAALIDREAKCNDAYPDPKHGWAVPTIGVGHTGPEVHQGLVWTDLQVMDALARDLRASEDAINAAVRVAVTQNQFDALVSFIHNVGVGAFQGSTLLRVLNTGDHSGASAQFRRWIIPAEVITRRAGEWVQWNTPDDGPFPARSQFDGRFP